MPEDPKYRERGSKGFIKNPDGTLNETNYTNANADINAAAAIIKEFYPNWRTEWLSNRRLKRGAMPKLKGVIEKVERLPELRRKHDKCAILINTALARANSDPAEALEGLKIMEREWKKLANLDKYGQKPSYKRNVELNQIEKNAPKKVRPQPPTNDDDGGGGGGGGRKGGKDKPVLSVNVTPKGAGRTSPKQGEIHSFKFGSEVFVQQVANPGYTFSHWTLDGNRIDDDDVLEVLMDRNHTVLVHYTGRGQGGDDGGDNPPEMEHRIIVRSRPCTRVPFVADGTSHFLTDHGVPVYANSQHEIAIKPIFVDGRGRRWIFQHWNDNVDDNPRLVFVENNNLEIVAIYKEKEPEPPPPPPPPPEQRRPVFRVIVDSNPTREVQITVENQQTIAPNRNLKPRDFANVLGVEVTNAIVGRAMQAAANFVGGGPYPDRAAAILAATNAANLQGINDRDFVDLLVSNFFGGEPTWVTLDAWRDNIFRAWRTLPAPRPPIVPFALTRPTGYLVNYSDNPVAANQFTIFTVEIPAGQYRFTAPETVHLRDARVENNRTVEIPEGQNATFDRWDIIRDSVGVEVEDIRSEREPERVIRSRRTGVTSVWNRVLELPDIGREVNRNGQWVPETIRIIAYYKANVAYDKFRPGMGGAYQGGTSGGAYNTGNRARRDSAYQIFGASPFQRGGINRRREEGKAKVGAGIPENQREFRNTATRAAVNKGKRILNQYARAEYTRIFANTRRKYEDSADRLREMRAEARAARRQLRAGLRAQMGMFKGRFFGGQTDEDLKNRATDTLQIGGAIGGGITAVQLQDARDALERFNKAYDEYFRDFKDAISSGAAQMESHMLERAETVSIQLARRFRMPLNGEDENEIAAKLREYALEITERFVARGRTGLFALTRGLENLSRGLQTGSEMGYGLLENTFNFIFGPWTITTVLALVFFFFVLTYVDYNITYLWIFPLIGAGFTFLLNFSDSFRPLDWVTHLSSGAIIGYSSVLLLISLGALNWSFMNQFFFWIIWGILGFLGVFQFYQTSGWRVVIQGGVIILIFSFVALGPYSAYYQQAINQVKTPVEIAYRAVSSAITDIWLLATNPTEWYARQQLVNVRPEKPIDFPKGLEIALLDALPPSVPGGREFALTTVIKHEGSTQAAALDASLSFGCNQWCIAPQPDPALAQQKYSLCHDDGYLFDHYFCGQDCGSNPSDDTSQRDLTLDNCIQACRDQESGITGSATTCLTKDKDKFLTSFGYVPRMERGDARAINVRGFTAVSQPGRPGEIRLAEVTVNLSYRYSTSTSLLTEVMTQSEIDRRIQENEPVFRNVLAVTKSSPAQLSLNVGPQPLTAGQKSLLLVSVSNTRDESGVVLRRDTKIIITLPRAVGSGLKCEGITGVFNPAAGVENLTYTVPQEVTVLPYNFQSIFAFICDFTAADPTTVIDVKSSLITAEMPDYTFVLTKEKQIPVTPPLGILFDPYELECRKCGTSETIKGSIANACDIDECHQLTNFDPAKGRVGSCWFEFSDKYGALPARYLADTCHSCSRDIKCERFLTPGDCESEARVCGMSCEWDPAARNPKVIEVNAKLRESSLDVTDGACKERIVRATSLGRCASIPDNYVDSYNNYRDKIATQLSVFPLAGVTNPNALVAALISKESDWTPKALNTRDPSYGLMQIVTASHPECDASKITSFDVDENLKCGIRYLSQSISACSGSVEGALRRYNTGSCSGTTRDPNYVGKIMGAYTDSTFSSGYRQWNACSSSLPVVGKGSADYCAQELANFGRACGDYQGGCKSDGECAPTAAGTSTTPLRRLACRSGVTSVGICCYPGDSNEVCLNNFNAWVAAP